MQCNPKNKASAESPIQLLLREIATQLDLHHNKIDDKIKSLQKVVVETLLLDTPSSAVDVEALELEAETAMTDLTAFIGTYKADIDKLPVPVLVNILNGACRSVYTLAEVPDLAIVLVAKEAEQHESYSEVFEIFNAVCEEGKKIGWVELRDQMVAEYRVEKLRESFMVS